MNTEDHKWDHALRIKTSGRDDSNADQYRFPYEPTDYCVLERLANAGYIRKKNTLIDYGCGKGRVGFFLSYQTRCHSIGIEYDERIYERAMENHKTGASAARTEFVLERAEHYQVPDQADRFYFFNPFSVEVLRGVLERILESYYRQPREMLLFFYYPSDEYISYLMTIDELEFYDEINCADMFEGNNQRERVVIFQIEAD